MPFDFAKTNHPETMDHFEEQFAALGAFVAAVVLDQCAAAARDGARRNDGMGDGPKD